METYFSGYIFQIQKHSMSKDKVVELKFMEVVSFVAF